MVFELVAERATVERANPELQPCRIIGSTCGRRVLELTLEARDAERRTPLHFALGALLCKLDAGSASLRTSVPTVDVQDARANVLLVVDGNGASVRRSPIIVRAAHRARRQTTMHWTRSNDSCASSRRRCAASSARCDA